MTDRPDELRGEACRLLESGLSIPLITRRLDRPFNSTVVRLMILARREARAAQGQDGSVWAAEGGRHG